MRIAIVSDVHANLAALHSVLEDAERRRGLDAVWSLGDFVGYGPQPNEVLALLRTHELTAVSGNHDLAATGGLDTSDFNDAAAAANRWNASQLTEDSAAYLRGLAPVVSQDAARAIICHGSLREPAWEYVITEEAARGQFERMDGPWSFVGHTHIPLVIEEAEHGEILADRPDDGDTISLGDRRLIVNAGGVGQPRDGDPRAAYAILDTADLTVTFHRVTYPIRETQALMEQAGLPIRLIRRLEQGR